VELLARPPRPDDGGGGVVATAFAFMVKQRGDRVKLSILVAKKCVVNHIMWLRECGDLDGAETVRNATHEDCYGLYRLFTDCLFKMAGAEQKEVGVMKYSH